MLFVFFFFFKQKTAYEMVYSDWSSDVCSSDLPAHGGANEAALQMLQEIGTVDRIPEYIKRAKDKSDPFRLMGFGHRVYKNYDPRAKIIKKACDDVLNKLGINDSSLEIAK